MKCKQVMMLVGTVMIGLFCQLTVTAQTNFSGTWSVKSKEHITGPEYENAVPMKMTISQGKDSLTIESVSTAGADKTATSKRTISLDGNAMADIAGGSQRKMTRSARWLNNKTVIELTTQYYGKENPVEVEITRIETWTLSADGKLLTIHRSSKEIKEDWEVKAVYEKN